MIRVSAIIACHNGEQFIREAIDSVLAQGCDTLEVIVADDASHDASRDLITAYGPPVHLVPVACGNTQATRNAAIAASSGELIAILDQDDRWHPDKLAHQLACLDADPQLGLCYTDTRVIDARGQELPERHNPLYSPRDQREALARLLAVNVIAASTVLIRRSVLERIGAFDPAFHLAGDWDLWLRVAESFPIAAVPEALVDYGWHANNLSHARIPMVRESIAVQEAALERIAHHPLWGADPVLRDALRDARRQLASRWSQLGSLLSKAGEREASLRALRRAATLSPGFDPRNWSRLARAWLRPARTS